MVTDTELPTLDVLYEAPELAGRDLGGRLGDAYRGGLHLPARGVYANFVSSIDGVAAERTRPRSSKDISGGDERDRFVMGLLRAAADAVVIGAGTLRAHAEGDWTPAAAFPDAADGYADLRREFQLPPRPRLAILSASGDLPAVPAVDGAIVFTTPEGSRALPSEVASAADVRIFRDDGDRLELREVIGVLHAQGLDRILTEGGPRLMAELLRVGGVDELFLTIAPRLAGRDASSDRPGIVDGLAVEPDDFRTARLLSLRRGGSLLFLRYGIRPNDPRERRAA
jgi:riboflavin biosynthesis pyrimidine reductase